METDAIELCPTRSDLLRSIKELVVILRAYRGDRLPIKDREINSAIGRAGNLLLEADGMIPTKEEVDALVRFAARYGKDWKGRLITLWMNGMPANEPDGGCLQRIRNRLGSTWLQYYTLPEPG